jgi:hypothetical protein
MSWAFAQFRPHVALRGRLCAVWDILARGVAKPGFYRLFYPSLLESQISPHISQGRKTKTKKISQGRKICFEAAKREEEKICFRYDVLYTF